MQLSVIAPCHRVIGSDGSLTGFAGGLDAKQFLLELEGVPLHTATTAHTASRSSFPADIG